MCDSASNDRPTLRLVPVWFGGDLMPESFPISPDLRRRLRLWNRTWEKDLNPVFEIRWQTIEQGRQWAQEGDLLIADLQSQLDGELVIVRGFDAYDPDSPDYEGVT